MKKSIEEELIQHVLECINDGRINEGNLEEAHFIAFNQDYYLIGYYNCNEWLKNHDLDVFEAIQTCRDYEQDNFGESTGNYSNSEKVVNMLAYIYGEELLYSLNYDSVEELKEELESIF
jgi:hypothetical protein